MTKAFVSYSRKDTEFTRKLTDALIAQQYELWVDWESIPPTVDWKLQIQKGVEEADTFLFLISPDSVKSRECLNELTLAITNGKRLIPLVVRQIDPQDSPNELKHINWIFFNKPEEFDKSFQKLLDAISTDYDWVQTHRRLQVKALEWDRAERENSFLLRGRDLEYAEGQLVVNASKDPKPTDLQREFILKSRSAAARQRRTTTAVLIGVAIAMLFLAVAAFIQRQNAIASEKVAIKNEQDAKAARAEAQLNEKVAEANAAEAQKNALIAQVGEVSSFALGKLDQDYNESLLYSVEAYRLAEKSGFNIERAKSAMLGTLQNQFGLAQVLPVHADWINSVAYSQDGSSMVSASADGISYLWDVSNPLNPVRLYQLDGDDIAISRDKKMLAASQYDEEFNTVIKLWNITDISKPATVSEFDGNFVLDFLPDGKSLIIQHSAEGRIFAENWNISDPSRPRLVSTLEGTSAALSPDGSILALSNADEQGQTVITLWNIVTPDAPVTLSTISGQFEVYVDGFDLRQTFTFSQNNKMLAIAGFDASDKAIVELWDVSDPSVPTKASSFASNSDWINSLAFSPDGELLAIGGNNGRIAMWDVSDPLNPSWNPSSNTLTGHSLAVNSMTFAPDGKTLASGSYDGTIMLWDMSGLSNPLLIHAPYGAPLALNANGDTLVTAYFDEALKTESTLIWDVSTPSAPVQTLELGMKSDLAAISSDNKLIVTSTYAEQEDADVNILWDISDASNPVEHRFVSADRIYNLKFSPHDTALLATTYDNTKEIYIS
ncbi:MAG: TIR domain-containing protein, partial [Chloroflexota bacterium]